MNRLPQELIDRISSLLPKHDLENILTLTGEFLYAAERCSGAFTEFTINERNSEQFLALYSGHRLPYLREMIFRPRFSPILYSYEPELPCRENADELREKDESFTRQIKFPFTALRSVKNRLGRNAFRSGIDSQYTASRGWLRRTTAVTVSIIITLAGAFTFSTQLSCHKLLPFVPSKFTIMAMSILNGIITVMVIRLNTMIISME